MISDDEKRAIRLRILTENHPSGICKCGHHQMDHGGRNGHGECYGEHFTGQGRCTCLKFTWVGVDPEVEKLIEEAIAEAEVKAELRNEATPAGLIFDL